MAQALPTTQSLSLLSPGLASAWVPSSHPSSVVPALRRAGRSPAAGRPAPSPGVRPAAQSSIHLRSCHHRHRAERRQSIARYRGCGTRGPSSREVRRVAELTRDALEGVWFLVKGLERDAQRVLSGKGDVALIRDIVRRLLRLPELLRGALREVEALCEVDSDQSGQLTLPVAPEMRCA